MTEPTERGSGANGRLLTRDGLGIHFEVVGEGPDIVIVPFAAALAGRLGALGRARTVIFYDMRGRGRSDPLPDPERAGFERDLDDLEDVRAHLRLDRISLIGFSYLGAVVSTYASRFPDRIASLVLLGSIGPSAAPGLAGVDQSLLDAGRLAALRTAYPTSGRTRDYCREYWDAYLPLYVGGKLTTGPAREALVGMCELENERPGSFLSVLTGVTKDLVGYDHRAVGRAIRARTLILHGDHDRVAPLANAEAWTDVIADARVELIRGAGHLLWAEAQEEVVRRLDAWLPRTDEL